MIGPILFRIIMKARLIPGLVVLSCVALSAALHAAETPRSLTWPDLQPPSVKKLEDQAYNATRKVDELDEEKREAYESVRKELSLRNRIELGFLDEERLDEKTKAILANPPSKQYPKALAFWNNIDDLYKKIEKERSLPNSALHDQTIRMPGYLLPLEFTKDKITEFLLVPYIGACMHAPTPPPNQMVFVTAEKPFASDRLYQAIWVQGVLRSETGKHKLSLVDGTTDVQASYTMQATLIEPYKR